VIAQAVLDAAGKYEISEIDFVGQQYYGIRSAMNIADVDSTIYGTTYGQLGAFCGMNALEMVGAPVSFGFEWNDSAGTCVIMPALPVASVLAKVAAPIELYSVASCKALVIDYYGEYDQTGPAHMQMEEYVQKNGLAYSVVMEEFVTDPYSVSTRDSCLTRIYYFLK